MFASEISSYFNLLRQPINTHIPQPTWVHIVCWHGTTHNWKKAADCLTEIKCLQHVFWMCTKRLRPLQRDLNEMLPHLWSVLLELSALLNEPLSRLLAFILPVRQYCCGGIEFPLSRETKGEDKIVIAFVPEKIISALDQNTREGPSTSSSSRAADREMDTATRFPSSPLR